jgi:hypothetical protein
MVVTRSQSQREREQEQEREQQQSQPQFRKVPTPGPPKSYVPVVPWQPSPADEERRKAFKALLDNPGTIRGPHVGYH